MIFIDHSPSISHYGVLGMKWGVRKDGKPQGFQYGKAGNRITKKQIDNGNSVIIKQGSNVYRSTRTSSEKFMKRDYTYVSVTPNITEHYTNVSDGFESAHNNIFLMKTKKDVKLANFNDFADALNHIRKMDADKTDNKRGINLLESNTDIPDGMFNASDEFNDVVSYLSNKGYDGMIDPIDGYAQYKYDENITSVVMFNPQTTLNIVNQYEIF